MAALRLVVGPGGRGTNSLFLLWGGHNLALSQVRCLKHVVSSRRPPNDIATWPRASGRERRAPYTTFTRRLRGSRVRRTPEAGRAGHNTELNSSELSHSFKVSDRPRNTPRSGQNRSESLCAGLWAPCRVFGAWFGLAFGPNPVRNQRFPAGSLKSVRGPFRSGQITPGSPLHATRPGA